MTAAKKKSSVAKQERLERARNMLYSITFHWYHLNLAQTWRKLKHYLCCRARFAHIQIYQ
jgi:hypothetical protein